MENIANFIDMDHLMCIFGTPSQLIQQQRSFRIRRKQQREPKRKSPRVGLRSGCRKIFKFKVRGTIRNVHDAVRPGEFFKVVQRLAGISTDADMDPMDVLESQDFGGSGSRDEGVRESLEGGSSGKFRKVSSK